jgi:hypothetical protein
MAGLVPAIHVLPICASVKTWMPATSAGMTESHCNNSLLWPYATRSFSRTERMTISAIGRGMRM